MRVLGAHFATNTNLQYVVVDGVEGKEEYDGFLSGRKLVFDCPKLLHDLAFQGMEIFRVEVEIVEID